MQDYNLPEYEEQIADPQAAAKLYKKKTAKFKVVWEATHSLIVEADTPEEAVTKVLEHNRGLIRKMTEPMRIYEP